MEGAQDIQLLVVMFGASPPPGFADLREPFRTVPWGIHFFAGTRNTPTAVQGLQPIHDSREIFRDGQITARQLLQRSQAVLSVIHRLDVVHVQLFGQLAGIDPITLTAVVRGILSRIAHQHFRDVGLQQVIQPGRPVPSSKVTRKSPRSPSMNCTIVLALVSMTHSITSLPREFLTAIEMLSVCTSMPIYLVLLMRVFLSCRE